MRKLLYKPTTTFGNYVAVILLKDKCLLYTNDGTSIITDAIEYNKDIYANLYGYVYELKKANRTSSILRKFASDLYDYINRHAERDDNVFDLLNKLVYTESEYESYRRYTFSKEYFKFISEVNDFEKVLECIDSDYTAIYETLYKNYLHSEQGINDYNCKENIKSFLMEVYNNFK